MTIENEPEHALDSTLSAGILPYQGMRRADAQIENTELEDLDIIVKPDTMQLRDEVINDLSLSMIQHVDKFDVIVVPPCKHIAAGHFDEYQPELRNSFRPPDAKRLNHARLLALFDSDDHHEDMVRIIAQPTKGLSCQGHPGER